MFYELLKSRFDQADRYIISHETDQMLDVGREALLAHYEHGDDSKMVFFTDRGVDISFNVTEFSRISPSDSVEELMKYPSRAERKLTSGEVISFNFAQMSFAIRNLLAIMMVPEEELKLLHSEEKSFIVALTSDTLQDPFSCLYVYSVFNHKSQEYEVERLSTTLRMSQDKLVDPDTKMFTFFDVEQNSNKN